MCLSELLELVALRPSPETVVEDDVATCCQVLQHVFASGSHHGCQQRSVIRPVVVDAELTNGLDQHLVDGHSCDTGRRQLPRMGGLPAAGQAR